MWLVRARPQTSAVRFDDQAANREPEPQTVRLGGVEGLEDVLKGAGASPGPQSRAATSTPPDSAFPVLTSNWRGHVEAVISFHCRPVARINRSPRY